MDISDCSSCLYGLCQRCSGFGKAWKGIALGLMDLRQTVLSGEINELAFAVPSVCFPIDCLGGTVRIELGIGYCRRAAEHEGESSAEGVQTLVQVGLGFFF